MLNVSVLMGRLTAAPELKTTTNGTSVTSFSLAVDRNYSKDSEKKTDFINCVAWRSNAEFITKYFGKGDMIVVTGEIQTRPYEDKNGNKRTAFEVIVNAASFCGGKNNGGNSAPEAAPIATGNDYDDGDDLPF